MCHSLTLSPRITAQTIPMCYSLSPPGSRLRLYQCVTHSLPPDHGSDYTNVLLTLSPRITAQTIPMCYSLSPPGSRLRLYQCVTHSLPPDHGSDYTNVSLTLSLSPDHGSDYTNVLLTLSPRITAQTIPMCYSPSPPGSRLRLYQCVTHSLPLSTC